MKLSKLIALSSISALGILAAVTMSLPAHAAKMDGAPAADCDGLTIATGASNKGYAAMYRDIKKVVGNNMAICEKTTKGGLDNLTDLSEKQADLGLAQVDTLKTMGQGDDNIASLQVVMPLNNNYLHIVALANGYNVRGEKKYGFMDGDLKNVRMTSFSSLRGQNVAAVGSAELLGAVLNKQLGYGMRFTSVKTDEAAFELVRTGKVAAAFTVAGWPVASIKALDANSGLTLIPFDAPIGSPYNVKPFNYKNIGAYNIPALAIQNVLVTRPFTGQKAQEVARLKQLIASNLEELKEGRYEPGWNEIKNVDATVSDLPRFNGPAAKAKK